VSIDSDYYTRPQHMTAPYSIQSLLQLLALCVKALEPLVDEEFELVDIMETIFSQSLAVLYKTLRYVTCTFSTKPF